VYLLEALGNEALIANRRRDFLLQPSQPASEFMEKTAPPPKVTRARSRFKSLSPLNLPANKLE